VVAQIDEPFRIRPGRDDLRKEWARLLGDVEPSADFRMTRHGNEALGGADSRASPRS